MAVQPGQKFDRYAVEELVGEGGMGRVYRAFDTRLERRVALKVLHAAGGDAAESVAVALREARAAAAIAHPNATAVYDAHEIDGTSFIAMEFVAGTSLRAIIAGPPVPLATRLRWLIDVAAALAAAHRMGVVHRDVKPENVMVRDDGLVKVLDFGVARRTVIDPPPNSRGEPIFQGSGARIAGTPAYMAPEQIRGEEIDGRADQFSWGVLAYELLTGQLPWRSARDLVGYIAAIVSEDPLPPGALVAGVPPPVGAAVLRALAKNRAQRFSGMLAAAAELAPFARTSLSMEAVSWLRAPVTAAPAEHANPSSEGQDPASDPTIAVAHFEAPSPADGAHRGGEPSTPTVEVRAAPASFDPPESPRHPVPSSGRGAPLSPGRLVRDGPSSSRPSPRSSEARARSGAERSTGTRAPVRRRWPFGSGFHEPDFEAPIDLEAHLACVPVEATCKGLFLLDLLQHAARVASEQEVFRVAQIPERRYVGFRDYPVAESLRLVVAAARVLYPRYTLGEGLRRAGQAGFDALLATHVGRAVFGVLDRDAELVLLAGPKAWKLLLSTGNVTAEKSAYRTFTFRASQFPGFLETFQVGFLEGALRHCGVRGRISVALDDLATATIELRLL
jgi:serine/threonine-protein kinase